MLTAFLHGFVLAFGLILPLGPQNVFIFSQGATQPKLWRAFRVVAVAALCDTLLILLAVFGVSVVLLTLPWLKTLLLVCGILFLLTIGWLTWRATPDDAETAAQTVGWSFRRQVVFALSVSLLNPHAILDTIGVIGTSAQSYANEARVAFTAACIAVSWLWFCVLAVVGRGAGRVPRVRRVLSRISAVIMWASAAYLLYTLYTLWA